MVKRNSVECGKDTAERMMQLCLVFDILAHTHLYTHQLSCYSFMVDAADPHKFPNAKKELYSLLSSPSLNGIPLLLLFNKHDLSDARSGEEIVDALGVKDMKGREIAYFEISCKDIINIDSVLDWLIKHSK